MNLINEIARDVFLIQPSVAQNYFFLLHSMLFGSGEVETPLVSDSRQKAFSRICLENKNLVRRDHSPSEPPSGEDPPSLFMVNILGAITKYDPWCDYGTKTILESLKQADRSESILGHVLNIDSGGGNGYAAKLLSDGIGKLSKPVFAFVDGMAASAAYWIASACSLVCASSPMDRIGSIGTYFTIADYKAWYASQGLKVIEVYARKSVEKNREFLEAISGDTSRLRRLADQYNEFFLSSVKENRSGLLDLASGYDSGAMYFATEAKDIGLIDLISSFDEFITHVFNELS